MNSKLVLVIAIIIVVAVAFVVLGTPELESGLHPEGSTQLSPVEVRSYEENDLSSINDFRENLIRGPQRINEADYRFMVPGLTNKTDA